MLYGQLTRQVLLLNLVLGTGVQHLPGGLSHLQPVPCAHQLPLAQCGPLAIHASGSTCKTAYKYPVTLHLHFVIASLRQYSMILQTLHSFLGILTLICRYGHQKKAVLPAHTWTMSCSSMSSVGRVTVWCSDSC